MQTMLALNIESWLDFCGIIMLAIYAQCFIFKVKKTVRLVKDRTLLFRHLLYMLFHLYSDKSVEQVNTLTFF